MIYTSHNAPIFGLIWALLLLFVTSCSETMDIVADQKLKFTGIEDCADALDFFSREDPFVIETTEEALMAPSFIRIIENDGIFYALDQLKKKVVAFDKTGKIKFVINAVGSGPNEYISISDIAWDSKKNRIAILARDKILYANEYGKIVDNTSLNSYYHYVAIADGNIFLTNSTYTNMRHAAYSISILDSDGNITETLPTLPEYAPFCMVNGPEISLINNEILFTRKFDSNIYQIDDQGNYRAKYGLELNGSKFNPEEGMKYDCVELAKICRETNRIYSMSDLQSGENYLAFNCNLSGLMIASKHECNATLYKYLYDYNKTPLPNYIPVENSNGLVFFYLDANYFNIFAQNSKDPVLLDLSSRIASNSNPVILPYRLR